MNTTKHPMDSLLEKIETLLTPAERRALGSLLETTALLLERDQPLLPLNLPPPWEN